jgi:hypothetical protein
MPALAACGERPCWKGASHESYPVAQRLGDLRKYSKRTSQRLRVRRRLQNGTTTKKGK